MNSGFDLDSQMWVSVLPSLFGQMWVGGCPPFIIWPNVGTQNHPPSPLPPQQQYLSSPRSLLLDNLCMMDYDSYGCIACCMLQCGKRPMPTTKSPKVCDAQEITRNVNSRDNPNTTLKFIVIWNIFICYWIHDHQLILISLNFSSFKYKLWKCDFYFWHCLFKDSFILVNHPNWL